MPKIADKSDLGMACRKLNKRVCIRATSVREGTNNQVGMRNILDTDRKKNSSSKAECCLPWCFADVDGLVVCLLARRGCNRLDESSAPGSRSAWYSTLLRVLYASQRGAWAQRHTVHRSEVISTIDCLIGFTCYLKVLWMLPLDAC